MALITYPATLWDSYVSLANAETIIANNIISPASWDALPLPSKELYLKQSTTLIRLKITDPSASTAPADLSLAVVYLTINSIGLDMIDSDGKENLKRIKIEGAIEKEYFTKSEKSNNFPDIVEALLAQYVYKGGSGSFSLNRS